MNNEGMNFVRILAVNVAVVLVGSAIGCGGSASNNIGSDDGGSGEAGVEAASSGASSGISSGTSGSATGAASGIASSGATSGTSTSGMASGGTGASGAATSGTSASGTATSGTAGSGVANSGVSASGTATSGTATSGSMTDAGAKPSAACATYCADIEGACAATQDKQYASAAECLTACAILEASNVATGMDTIVCRRTEATDAIKGPLPHCWRAGPYGYDVCGDQCEAFCILADSACASTYADCKTTCATFTKVPAPTTVAEAAHVYTSSGPTTGNTLDCREYYLGLAVEGTDKATACANAGEASPKCK